MTSLWQDHSIDAGCFINSVGVLLSISTDATSADEIVHSRLILYFTNNGAVREVGTYPWKILSMAMANRGGPRTGYALSEDGPLLRVEQAGSRELSAGAPPYRGSLRKVRSVGDAMVVVGMRHQVLAVQANDTWQDLSPAAPPEGQRSVESNTVQLAGLPNAPREVQMMPRHPRRDDGPA